jgi:capsular exopolysaccharide synthesis family protein
MFSSQNGQAAALVSLTAPDSFTAEQYQGLRLKIEALRQDTDLRAIGVSSPGEGDGKTVTAINLAGALAQGAAARVLLIDADFRSPSIGGVLGLDPAQPGFSDAIAASGLTLDQVVQPCAGLHVDVVTAGASTLPVHDILRSPRLGALLADARGRYDYVLVDTPPLVPVFDSALLARSLDGMLLVVAAHRTPRPLLADSLSLLDPAKVVGIVFNRDDRSTLARNRGRSQKYFRRPPGTAAA